MNTHHRIPHLGLSDYERAEKIARRKERNCMILIALCVILVGVIEKI